MKTAKKYRGILFDFDGVALKSMEQHFTAWQMAFGEKDIELHPDEFYVLEGQGVHVIAHLLGKCYGLTEYAANEIMERKFQYYNQIMHVEFYDYFKQMVHNFYGLAVPMGVVTGGNRSRVEKVVNQHFNAYFKALVTVDDVEKGKPHPDPFLMGAKYLGIPAESCIVVENAPLGIKGAKSAGMTVIGITTTLAGEHLREADHIAGNFVEVEKILNSLIDP